MVSIPLVCTPGQRPGLNTLDAGRRVGVGQGDNKIKSGLCIYGSGKGGSRRSPYVRGHNSQVE